MRPVDKLSDGQAAELDWLRWLCGDLATIRDLARGFTDLVRARRDCLSVPADDAQRGVVG
jgi:hypothetical protein